jgi:hypothetical protein
MEPSHRAALAPRGRVRPRRPVCFARLIHAVRQGDLGVASVRAAVGGSSSGRIAHLACARGRVAGVTGMLAVCAGQTVPASAMLDHSCAVS